MGKGSRSRVANAERQAQKAEALAKETKIKKIKKAVYCAVAGILVIAVALVAIFAIRDDRREKNGYSFHKTVAVKSKNYKVTTPMMAYFVDLQYTGFQQQYSSQLSSIQLDTAQPLKDQACDPNVYPDGNITWFEYFYNNAEKQVSEMLCMLEEADKNGFKLSKTDKKTVDDTIKQMETAAEEYDMTVQEYLDYAYGKGTKLKEIRTAMEWYQRSSSYYNKQYGDKDYSKAEIESYYNKNAKKFNTADYASYDFTANIASYGADGAAVNGATSKIKEEAAKVSAAKSFDEFNKLLKDYLTEYYKGNEDYPESQIDNIVTNSHNATAQYIEDDPVSEWAFDKNTKAGEVKTFESTTDDIFKVTVAVLVAPMKRDESVTRDIRHILFSNEQHGTAAASKAEAEKALEEYNKGEHTEDAFAALAAEKTEDPGSKENGGLYENVTQGQMVPSFNDWMFDAARQKGDTGIVESDYGYHVMYYPGRESVAWEKAVEDTMTTEKYNKTMEKLKNDFKIKSVNRDKIFELIDM